MKKYQGFLGSWHQIGRTLTYIDKDIKIFIRKQSVFLINGKKITNCLFYC